jgi:hypothetical protein
VDVVFAESVIDDTGPAISEIKAHAIDGSNAVVTWKTDEEANSLVEYSLDPGLPPAETLSVSNSAFVLNHADRSAWFVQRHVALHSVPLPAGDQRSVDHTGVAGRHRQHRSRARRRE